MSATLQMRWFDARSSVGERSARGNASFVACAGIDANFSHRSGEMGMLHVGMGKTEKDVLGRTENMYMMTVVP